MCFHKHCTKNTKGKFEAVFFPIIIIETYDKVHFNLLTYFIHMRHNINGSLFLNKKQDDFEEKKFNGRFGECLFMYHVTK